MFLEFPTVCVSLNTFLARSESFSKSIVLYNTKPELKTFFCSKTTKYYSITVEYMVFLYLLKQKLKTFFDQNYKIFL